MLPVTRCVACALLTLLAAPALFAQDPAALQRENAELRALVEALQGQVQALSTRVDDMATSSEDTARRAVDEALSSRIDEMVATMSPMVQNQSRNGYALTWYGFIKADFAADTGRLNDGDFPRFVERNGEDDGQLSFTTRQTRLGLNIDGPETKDLVIKATFEVDFFTEETNTTNSLQLSQAFVSAHWKRYDITFLAGQTWDVISPLVAPTLNTSGLWFMGDIGFRRAQLRVTKGYNFRQDQRIEFVLAASREIEGLNENNTVTGEDGGLPSIQARVEYSGNFINNQHSIMGIYGMYGEEEVGLQNGSSEQLDSYVIGLYFDIGITKEWRVRGDGFYGSALGNFLGGVGQRASFGTPNSAEAIDTIGGWVAVTWTPMIDALRHFTFNAGLGTDDPDNDNLAIGQRTSNFVAFGNAIYDLAENTQVGLGLMWLETGYFGDGADDSFRVQGSVTFSF